MADRAVRVYPGVAEYGTMAEWLGKYVKARYPPDLTQVVITVFDDGTCTVMSWQGNRNRLGLVHLVESTEADFFKNSYGKELSAANREMAHENLRSVGLPVYAAEDPVVPAAEYPVDPAGGALVAAAAPPFGVGPVGPVAPPSDSSSDDDDDLSSAAVYPSGAASLRPRVRPWAFRT